MASHIADFFRIPPELRPDFWETALLKNSLSLLVICIMILGMELFNMARVLLWSSAGLGTVNNRIYFGMYCALFLAAAIYLAAWRLLRRAPVSRRWGAQFAMVFFALLWHICLNAYDLMRDSGAEVSLFLTAFLALAVFIQMPPAYSLFSYITAYTVFMVLAGPILDSGARINLTITAIVALAVSLTTCRHAVVELTQRREIQQMNLRLQNLLQKDPLTGLLNTAAFRRCAADALAHAGKAEENLSLFIADLDNFKAVNDRFGHLCGDHVLRETGRALSAAFPDAIAISRIGGDEFAVVLRDRADTLPQRLERHLLPALARIQWEGAGVGVSCSAGICRIRSAGASYEAVYHTADQALYEAKAQGKGRSCLHILP